jgi:hypothetical protein
MPYHAACARLPKHQSLFDTPQKSGLTPSAKSSSASSLRIQKPETSFVSRAVVVRSGGRGRGQPDGAVLLLIVYSKAKFDNLPAPFLAQLKKGVEDAI